MVKLKMQRDELICLNQFIPLWGMLKVTLVKNCGDVNTQSSTYLDTLALCCTVDEISIIIQRAHLRRSNKNKLQFSDAQGVVLLRLLKNTGLYPNDFYATKLRDQWMMDLDRQLISNAVYNIGRYSFDNAADNRILR